MGDESGVETSRWVLCFASRRKGRDRCRIPHCPSALSACQKKREDTAYGVSGQKMPGNWSIVKRRKEVELRLRKWEALQDTKKDEDGAMKNFDATIWLSRSSCKRENDTNTSPNGCNKEVKETSVPRQAG